MLLGIESHIWIVGILLGGVVAASVNQMRPKHHIPLAEIYFKKAGAIVWFEDEQKHWWPYALKKTKQGYFPMYTDRVKGLFKINKKFAPFYMGNSNTPNYLLSTIDMNSYDPISIGKVNEFLQKNGIDELRHKDLKHIEKLKSLGKGLSFKDGLIKLKKAEAQKDQVLNDEIQTALSEAESQINKINEEKRTNYQLDDRQAVYYLINYMLRKDIIDDDMANNLIYQFENEVLDLTTVIQEIKETTNIMINESVDTDIVKIAKNLGSQNPLELTGVIDDARTNPKELKKMTPVPVKQFIPGGVILAIGIVIIMGIAVIGGNPDLLGNLIGGGGGFKIPFT